MLYELSDEEAEYVEDILQMWSEGAEAEIPKLTNTAQPDVHWSLFQLRKQIQTAQEVKLRMKMQRTGI